MKKLLVLVAFAVFALTNVNAQDGVDKVVEQAKSGGFKVGGNIGFSLLNSSLYNLGYDNNAEDFGSFNFGVDVAYLFEVMPNLEVGALVGYTQFLAKGSYVKAIYDNDGNYEGVITADFKDASFVPISTTARYYFANHKFFGGLDLGYAVNVAGDDGVDGGLYLRPKFGFNLGAITLIASYQKVGGGVDYDDASGSTYYSLSGFNSFNVGAEFSF